MDAIDLRSLIGDRPKILIIKLRGVGDVLLATPVAENLKKNLPDSSVSFLVEEASRDVLVGNPYLDEIIGFPRTSLAQLPRATGLERQWRFLLELRARRFGCAIDLFGNPRSALMSLSTGSRLRVGFDFRVRRATCNLVVPRTGERIHEVDFNLLALQHLGVQIVSRRPLFPLTRASRSEARSWLSRFPDGASVIGLAPCGGWQAKRWPLSSFALLGDELARRGHHVVLLWGPGELRSVEEIARCMAEPVSIIPEMGLGRLGAIMEGCRLIVANDSGPMHIAAAIGRPVLGIFGPTDPELQGPLGPQHRVVWKRGLDCLGCNRTECEENFCMSELAVDDVLGAALEMLEERKVGDRKREIA